MFNGIHWIFMIHYMNGIQWTNVNSCYAIWIAVPTPFYNSTTLFIDILNLVHSNKLSNVLLYILSCVFYILTDVSIKWLSGVSASNQVLRKIPKTMIIRIERIVRYMNNSYIQEVSQQMYQSFKNTVIGVFKDQGVIHFFSTDMVTLRPGTVCP